MWWCCIPLLYLCTHLFPLYRHHHRSSISPPFLTSTILLIPSILVLRFPVRCLHFRKEEKNRKVWWKQTHWPPGAPRDTRNSNDCIHGQEKWEHTGLCCVQCWGCSSRGRRRAGPPAGQPHYCTHNLEAVEEPSQDPSLCTLKHSYTLHEIADALHFDVKLL